MVSIGLFISGYKRIYCNYYIANTKVIVSIYYEANDEIAIQKLQTLFTNRTVAGIDFRNVYANGGMTHCITQQQPLSIKQLLT